MIIRTKHRTEFSARNSLIILSILFLSITSTACAASSDKNIGNDGFSAPAQDEDMAYETTVMSVEHGSGNLSNEAINEDETAERKIIRNAQIDMTTINVTQTYESILAQAQADGGYELSREQYEENDYTVIKASIKLPPEHLDSLIDFIRGTGDLVNLNISTSDITESYYDTEIRLESMEKSLDKYYEYLDDSRNIEEAMMVQNQINSLTMEIESLKGRLRLWDSQLAESTLDLYIRQENDPVLIRKEVDWSALSLDDMSYLMTSGLKTVVNILTGTGQWLLIILVAGAPLWIPVIIIAIILIRRSRKKKQRRVQAIQTQQQFPQQQHAPVQQAQIPTEPNNSDKSK